MIHDLLDRHDVDGGDVAKVCAVSPAEEIEDFVSSLKNISKSWQFESFMPSSTPNPHLVGLGVGLAHHVLKSVEEGYDRVVFIGTDTPQLSTRVIKRAIREFPPSTSYVVPSTDGGYVLLSLGLGALRLKVNQESVVGEAFSSIEWSTPRTGEQQIAALHRAGVAETVEVETEEIFRDVDEEEDWRWLREEMERFPAKYQTTCPRTYSYTITTRNADRFLPPLPSSP